MIAHFLSYPGAGGAEIFELQVRPWLKWFTGFIKVLVNPYLSPTLLAPTQRWKENAHGC